MDVKLFVAGLVFVLAGCSSSSSPSGSPTPTSSTEPDSSWLAMAPGDVRTFDGPGGRLVLIFVDETYDIDGTYVSALTWKVGRDYTTDYFVQDDDGTLWWYGRKGAWRVGRGGEEPREVDIRDDAAEFGELVVTLSEDGPVQVETPDGVYTG